MDISKAIGDRLEFIPLHKLVFFSTDATVGEVLEELGERNSSLCLVRDAAGIRLTTVPHLLHIAAAHARTPDAIGAVSLQEILTRIDAVPSIELEVRRTGGSLRRAHEAPAALSDIENLGYGYIYVAHAPKGLAMSRAHAAAAMVPASYWICKKRPKPYCISAAEPPDPRCVVHGQDWNRKH